MGTCSSGSNQQPPPIAQPTTTGTPITEIPQELDTPKAQEPTTQPQFEAPKNPEPPQPEIKISPPAVQDILPTIEIPLATSKKDLQPKKPKKQQHSDKKSKQYTMKNSETIVRNQKQLHNRRMTKQVVNRNTGFVQFQINRNNRDSRNSSDTMIVHNDEENEQALQVDISEIQEVYDDSEESLILNIPNSTNTYEPEVKHISFAFEPEEDQKQIEIPEEQIESSHYEQEDESESEIYIEPPPVVETPTIQHRITKRQLLMEAIREKITNQTPIIKELHAFPIPSTNSPRNNSILNAKEKKLVGSSNTKPTQSYSVKFKDQKQTIRNSVPKDTGNPTQNTAQTNQEAQNSQKQTSNPKSDRKRESQHVRSQAQLAKIRYQAKDIEKSGNMSKQNRPTFQDQRDPIPIKS